MSKLSKWAKARWGRGPSMKGAISSIKGTAKFAGKLASVGFPGAGRAASLIPQLPSTPRLPPMVQEIQEAGFGGGVVGGALAEGGMAIARRFASGVRGFAGGGKGRIQPGPQGCPKGYHLNKSALDGGRIKPRTVCVRNRSMNPANGRAIMRATRRIRKGERVLRKIFSVTGRKAGKIKPKFGRKKS